MRRVLVITCKQSHRFPYFTYKPLHYRYTTQPQNDVLKKIQNILKKQNAKEAFRIFETTFKPKDIHFYNEMINVFLPFQIYTRKILNMMKEENISPNIETYTLLMKSFNCGRGLYKHVFNLFDEAISHLEPTREMFHLLFQSAFLPFEKEYIFSKYNKMKELQLVNEETLVFLFEYIYRCAKEIPNGISIEEVKFLFDDLNTLKIEQTPRLFGAAIKAVFFISERHAKNFFETIVQTHANTGKEILNEAYLSLAYCYSRTYDKKTEALNILQKMQDEHSIRLSTEHYNIFLRVYADTRNEQLLDKLISNMSLNEDSKCILMKFYAKKNLNIFLKYYTSAKKKEEWMLVQAFINFGRIKEAIEYFQKWKEGREMDLEMLKCLLTIPQKESHHFTVSDFLRMSNESKLVLDLEAYQRFIKAFCRNGQMGEAEKIFAQLQQDGYVPNSFLYSELIDSYLYRNKLNEATLILGKMTANGLVPLPKIYRIFIRKFLEKKLYDKAIELIDDLISNRALFSNSFYLLICEFVNECPKLEKYLKRPQKSLEFFRKILNGKGEEALNDLLEFHKSGKTLRLDEYRHIWKYLVEKEEYILAASLYEQITTFVGDNVIYPDFVLEKFP